MSEQESTVALTSEGGDGGEKQTALAAGNESFFGRIGKFWREAREEMRRVSWPSFDDVKKTTVITLIAVAVFGLYLFLVDQGIVLLGRFGTWLLGQIGLA
jgi:preprotein translocase subunit SecE